MKVSEWRLTIALLACVGWVACGQGTEPISNLGDPSQASGPGLVLPMNGPFSNFIPYSQTNGNTFWGMVGASFFSTTTPIFAPGSGFVMVADAGGQTVSILHNQHIYSKVIGVLPTGITAGSYVIAGAQIGTIPNSLLQNRVTFSVYVDGNPVCPLSYLTGAARAQVTNLFYGSFYSTNPCLQ